MPTWLIWLIVIVVVVALAVALYAMTGKRRTETRRRRADELREAASSQAAALPETQRDAEELRAKADLASTEAERAEERAATAEQGHRIEQASYEDKLREADRLDPDVDHKAADYEPDVWNDERADTEAETSRGALPTRESAGPRHAGSPEDTTVAQRTEDPEAEAAASEQTTPRPTSRPSET